MPCSGGLQGRPKWQTVLLEACLCPERYFLHQFSAGSNRSCCNRREESFNNNHNIFLYTSHQILHSVIKGLLQNILTDKINNCEMFVKGIGYSYYYEESEE